MQLTLNGIVQGHAADRALAVLAAHGVRDALVDAGEFAGIGLHPGGTPWRIGVRDPLEPARLLGGLDHADAAVATSAANGYIFDGDGRHHHIFDPRTGRSPAGLAGVSVLAPDATTADALSTACMVMGVDRSLALLAELPDVHGLFVRGDGSVVRSSGLDRPPMPRVS
jgi:thiamine biosynthesis lipoprotein